jgi:hypothetical protein
MAMNATKYPNNIRTVSGLNVVVFDNDVELSVNTSTIACSIDLPAIASGYWNTTWKLYVFDASNNAAANNITINAGSGQKINGASSLVINTNGAGIMIRVLSNTSFIAITTYTAGGGGGGVLSVAAVAPLTSSGGTSPIISSLVTGSTLLGRSTLTAGIMEEITLGTNLAFVGTTLNASGGGITSLNTLTAATQTMVVGTANSDFTITSGTSTHTFDLPTASASKRGALSTQDWTTFNNKLSSAYVTVQDEGTPLTARSTMNFVGTGVVASDIGSVTTVTINNAVIQNTVYVMKSGNDSTGLVQRFDKPFLTIAAARNAALVAFTSRTIDNRVRIIVESGEYAEGIIIDDFIDYDLGNSVISPLIGVVSCITDNGSAYTLTTKNKYTAMIYGNATFNASYTSSPSPSGYYGLAITDANSVNLNLYLECNQINSQFFDAIYMKTGKATVYANYISNSVTDTNTYNVIRLSSGTANPPTLQVFNATIYNATSLSINACVFFENISGGTAVNKCMLTNCQVGNYSSALGAITCAISNNLGIGQITLNNTTIYCASVVPSLTDGYLGVTPPAVAPNVGNILRSYVYGVFASYAATYVNTAPSQSATVVGAISTNTSLIFNQGNPI